MANKNKKRHANSSAAMRQRAENARIADEKDRYRKRMNPIARNILFGDLVFLAATAMLEESGFLPKTYSNFFAVIGAAILALFVLILITLHGKKLGFSGKARRRRRVTRTLRSKR